MWQDSGIEFDKRKGTKMLEQIAGLALLEFWIVQGVKAVLNAIRVTIPDGWVLYIHIAITGSALAVVFFVDNFPEFAGILPVIEQYVANAATGLEAFTAIALLLGGPPIIYQIYSKLQIRFAGASAG